MPVIRTIRPKMLSPKPLPPLPTSADVTGEYPTVVVVDSGISDQIPGLESWVVYRESQVAPAYRNTDHGSFVAGLICWGNQLNPHIAGIDASPCGVFDLQVIPNDDPAKGDTLELLESELLVSLDEALQQHANNFKVWNLSLGTSSVCSLDSFSKLAEELDNLQERYQVSFVISAGNYETPRCLTFHARLRRCRLAESPHLPTAFWASPWAPSPTSTIRPRDHESIARPLSPDMAPDRTT
jgi:hypothetical protein